MSTWNEEPKREDLDREKLPARAAELLREGQRLTAITCTAMPDALDLIYSFDKGYSLLNLRVTVPKSDPTVPSITDSYFCAFTYENELQDLFGMKVKGLKLDFGGNFYRKAMPAPFKQAEKAN